MKKYPRPDWKRVTRLGVAALVAALLVGLSFPAYLAFQYAHHFTHVGCFGTLDSLETQGYPSEMVKFTARQGYTLRGWFAPGSRYPEAAIVVLPGASGNSQFALPDAAILAKAGYSTLIYEHRSCADPALIHSGGYYEAFDLTSAVAYLWSRPEIRHVGVLGFSAGGTAALLAAADQKNIEAVVAEGGFSSMEADALDPQSPHDPLDWTVRRLTVFFLGVEMGVPVSKVSPLARIKEISPRPLLLIYGEREAWHGQTLYAAAGEPKTLWIVPGVGHGGYHEAYPEEYETRILNFFQKAFGLEP